MERIYIMKRFMMLVLSVFIFALMASCDDGSSDSTEKIYTTVRVYAAYDEEAYQADVGVGEDNVDETSLDPPEEEDDHCTDYYYFEDEILVTIYSNAIPNLPMDPSSVKLLSYTVTFIPLEDSPAVPSKHFSHDIEIAPNTSVEIPIRILDQEDKTWFSSHPLNRFDYWDWMCSPTGGVSYEYTVNVEMKIVEVLTGDRETIEINFPLYYFDIGDDCAPSPECW